MCEGDVFSSHVDKLFEGIPSDFPVIDDLTVCGEAKTKHDIDLLEACDVA